MPRTKATVTVRPAHRNGAIPIDPPRFSKKPTVCVDLDATILDYSGGWRGRGKFGKMLENVPMALARLKGQGCRVIVLTSRLELARVARLLEKYGLATLVDGVTNRKVPALAYMDDRAVPILADTDSALLIGVEDWILRHPGIGPSATTWAPGRTVSAPRATRAGRGGRTRG